MGRIANVAHGLQHVGIGRNAKEFNRRRGEWRLMAVPPKFSQSDLTRIPNQMRISMRWLLWRYIPNVVQSKKPRKVPYYADGTLRRGVLDNAEDLARLATLPEALAALHNGSYSGIGFALGPDGTGNHWQGIDIDDIAHHPNLADFVTLLPGYVEKSPSGNGIHAIGYGKAFPALGSNETGIEAYSTGRFFTVTGVAL